MRLTAIWCFLIAGMWIFSGYNYSLIRDEKIKKDSLICFARAQLGKKYVYGNFHPSKGFDCSGFVYYVFDHFKVKVPRSSSQYENFGRKVPKDSCLTGDIIVFTGTNSSIRKPGHVGIIFKDGNKLQFIHSSSDTRTPGVKISNYDKLPGYQKRFLKIVRVCKVY